MRVIGAQGMCMQMAGGGGGRGLRARFRISQDGRRGRPPYRSGSTCGCTRVTTWGRETVCPSDPSTQFVDLVSWPDSKTRRGGPNRHDGYLIRENRRSLPRAR
jgi:hypothetical protein